MYTHKYHTLSHIYPTLSHNPPGCIMDDPIEVLITLAFTDELMKRPANVSPRW